MDNSPSKLLYFFFEYGLYVIPLLIGVAGFFLFNYLYPLLDKKIVAKAGGYIDWMVLHLDRIFVKASKQQCMVALMFSTAAFGCLGFIITLGNGFLNFVFTVSFLYMGWALPRVIITLLWKRRMRKFDLQLTDALDLMANSIKSGLNLLQIIQVVIEEMPNPLSQEFQLVLNQHHLGISLDDALKNMGERMPTDDLSMALSAILILRETGGDLSETFEVIASTIRERRKVEGRIRAIREQALFQSIILFVMPFGIAVTMYFINPGYLNPLFESKWGYLMIGAMLTLQAIGGIWLRKLVNIDV